MVSIIINIINNLRGSFEETYIEILNEK